MRHHLLAAVIAALALGACKGGPPTIGDPPPKLADASAEAAYREVLEKYSGQAQVYAGLDTHMFSGATFQTWAFREARVMRLAKFKSMTEPEIAALLAEERAEYDKFHVFVFGAWTQEPRFDDFDRKESIWRVAMVAEGVEVLPIEVDRITRVNQDTRAIYPYMGQFWVAYRAKFPKAREDGTPVLPPGTREVMLQLASTLGKAEMRAAAE